MPAPRDYGSELQGILPTTGWMTGNYVGNQQTYGPALSRANVGNFRTALLGDPTFRSDAYAASRPDLVANFNADPGYAQHYGSLDNYLKADFDAWGNNDPRFVSYNNSGALGLAREANRAANPELAAYTEQLGQALGGINAPGYSPVQATGYTPTLATTPAASVTRATQQRAGGGPLLGQLNAAAGNALGTVSPLQARQETIAMNLLGAGGGLTAGELAGVQGAVRSAYSDRGMLRSNRGIGAEILATDQAQRGRLRENLGIAQAVDAAGQGQLANNRGFALGVQGRGQDLSMFNAAQGNALGQFNAGAANDISRFNAGLGQQTNLANAAAGNQAGQFNATAANQLGMFNAGMAQQNASDQWNRAMQYGQFQLAQRIDPVALAGGLTGQTPDYTGAALGYGGDVYGSNFNYAVDKEISGKNNKAALLSAGLSAVGTIGGAVLGGPIGAALGSQLGRLAGGGGAAGGAAAAGGSGLGLTQTYRPMANATVFGGP